jgi:hypothetical protein
MFGIMTSQNRTVSLPTPYLTRIGAALPAFSAAMFASFCSLSARTWRKYLNRRMNDSSILYEISKTLSEELKQDVPFLGHHQESLHQQPLEDLGSNTLKQCPCTLVLNDVLHDLCKGFEGLAISCWRGFRLQANLGDDERLCDDRGKHL